MNAVAGRVRQVVVGEGISIERLAPQELAAAEIRISVAYSGICGSELRPILDGAAYGGGHARDTTFGHEFSGIVAEVGEDVDAVAPGDPVVCFPRWPCGECRQCRSGRLIYCERIAFAPRGAWADEIVVPARVVFRVPDGVSLRVAALCEPLACALRGLDRAAAPVGHTALVVGAGPIGLLAATLALRSGARAVLVSEPHPRRRALAAGLGAVPVDPTREHLSERVAAVTDGLGMDVIYEAVGRPGALAEAVELAAPGGAVVVLGVAPHAATSPIRPYRLFEREVTVTGAFGPEAAFERALGLLATLELEPLITHVLSLDDVRRAVDIAASGDCGKVLLAP